MREFWEKKRKEDAKNGKLIHKKNPPLFLEKG